LDWARSVGDRYATEPLPAHVNVPAMDAGLGLLSDLYDLTGEPRWIESAQRLAADLVDIYFEGVLPAGASGIKWYESQMGPGFLLHGLARPAFLSQNRQVCVLASRRHGQMTIRYPCIDSHPIF